MIKFLLVTAGLIELYGLFTISEKEKFLKDMEKLKVHSKSSKDWTKKYINFIVPVALTALAYLGAGLYELLVIALGIAFLSSPLSWLVASTLLVGLITGKLRKTLDKELFKRYLVLDYLYCASVFIIGPMIW